MDPTPRERQAVTPVPAVVTAAATPAEAAPPPITNLWQRIIRGLQLQTHYDHPLVQAQMAGYSANQAYFGLVAERAQPFLFAIVEEIERRGMPLELALLPMVESTFDPNAQSTEHAVGLWQFLGSTADSFGLQRDWWYDGRRDPLAATNAALDYLGDLYRQFNKDWLLALAAYNAGDGNVRRAIRHSGSVRPSYWELELPRETRSHIPKLLGLAAVIAGADSPDLTLPAIANERVIAQAPLQVQIDLTTAAGLMDMEVRELRRLNPGYLQWATHPDHPQALTVPLGKVETLLRRVAEIPAGDRVAWDNYRIAPGDTLTGIAAKLNTRVDILRTVNAISGSRIIAGGTLLIPRLGDPNRLGRLAAPDRNNGRVEAPPGQYRVRRGDNLWSIARRFDLHSIDIARHNNIELEGTLMPGQILDLGFARADWLSNTGTYLHD